MNPFAFTQATDVDAALAALLDPDTRPIAGGTNLLDLMKESVMKPSRVVDINNLGLDQVEEQDGGLMLGALARNADTAYHPLVRERYPLLSTAILAGASPGRRWNSAKGIARWPRADSTCTVASRAASATHMSEGWVAMQWSLAPRMACCLVMPPMAEQPLPGSRLLQGVARS